jgi:hypothetical protein
MFLIKKYPKENYQIYRQQSNANNIESLNIYERIYCHYLTSIDNAIKKYKIEKCQECYPNLIIDKDFTLKDIKLDNFPNNIILFMHYIISPEYYPKNLKGKIRIPPVDLNMQFMYKKKMKLGTILGSFGPSEVKYIYLMKVLYKYITLYIPENPLIYKNDIIKLEICYLIMYVTNDDVVDHDVWNKRSEKTLNSPLSKFKNKICGQGLNTNIIRTLQNAKLLSINIQSNSIKISK